jgi:hypothetical protein
MMNQLRIMAHLKKFYDLEVEKLRGMVQRLEIYIDHGLAFRKECDQNIANLSKAIADLDDKIEAQQRGEDVADDWWKGAGE